MSSSRKYLSGAQKRKLAEKKEEEKKKIVKIDTFFQTKDISNLEKPSASTSLTSPEVQVYDEETPQSNFKGKNVLSDEKEDTDLEPTLESSPIFSSDISLYLNTELNDDIKKELVHIGSHRPDRPLSGFPKDDLNRSFSDTHYKKKTSSGQMLDRFWISYSETLNGVYCHPCWLFAEKINPSFNPAWTTGKLNDWKGLSKKIVVHENSRVHLNACLVYSTWKANRTVDICLKEDIDRLKAVLKIIIDVTRTIAMSHLPFRGHRDVFSEDENKLEADSSKGIFLNIVKLLARYDPVLEVHINKIKKRSTHYLSNTSQNQFITLISDSILQSIVEDIKDSPFFSIIVDTTQDISKKDQLSLVFRHINLKEGKIVIQESFLGFYEMIGQSAKDFENEILQVLEKYEISLYKFRGQGYDGAANMSGKYAGLQALIKQRQPNADYIHCAAHNLNLILNDSVSYISEIRNFFDTVQCLYVFFSESLPRWQILNSEIKNSKTVGLTLKKLCPTRWSSRAENIMSLKSNYLPVVKCLSNLTLIAKKRGDRDEAKLLKNKIENFEFIFLLHFQGTILETINMLSKCLQKNDIDIGLATDLISGVFVKLKNLRDNFENVFEMSVSTAKTWNIEPELKPKRVRTVKKFFDEIAADEPIKNHKNHLKISVFNACLDIILAQFGRRYDAFKNVYSKFEILNPQTLLNAKESDILTNVEKLVEKYPEDLTQNLALELIQLKTLLWEKLKNIHSNREFSDFIFEKNQLLISSIPEICTAFQLFLVLPVTSAQAERTFSKLNLIKSFARSTMTQSRLSSLAIISIENKRAKDIDLGKVVDKFISLRYKRSNIF